MFDVSEQSLHTELRKVLAVEENQVLAKAVSEIQMDTKHCSFLKFIQEHTSLLSMKNT